MNNPRSNNSAGPPDPAPGTVQIQGGAGNPPMSMPMPIMPVPVPSSAMVSLLNSQLLATLLVGRSPLPALQLSGVPPPQYQNPNQNSPQQQYQQQYYQQQYQQNQQQTQNQHALGVLGPLFSQLGANSGGMLVGKTGETHQQQQLLRHSVGVPLPGGVAIAGSIHNQNFAESLASLMGLANANTNINRPPSSSDMVAARSNNSVTPNNNNNNNGFIRDTSCVVSSQNTTTDYASSSPGNGNTSTSNGSGSGSGDNGNGGTTTTTTTTASSGTGKQPTTITTTGKGITVQSTTAAGTAGAGGAGNNSSTANNYNSNYNYNYNHHSNSNSTKSRGGPKLYKNVVPCRARGMPMDHNFKNAYFVVTQDTKQGDQLVCSYPQCRNGGVKFRYCATCRLPVAQRNFHKRHVHNDDHQHPQSQSHHTDQLHQQQQQQDGPKVAMGSSGGGGLINKKPSRVVRVTNSSKQLPSQKGKSKTPLPPTVSYGGGGGDGGDGSREESSSSRRPDVTDARRQAWSLLLMNRPEVSDDMGMSAWLMRIMAISDRTKPVNLAAIQAIYAPATATAPATSTSNHGVGGGETCCTTTSGPGSETGTEPNTSTTGAPFCWNKSDADDAGSSSSTKPSSSEDNAASGTGLSFHDEVGSDESLSDSADARSSTSEDVTLPPTDTAAASGSRRPAASSTVGDGGGAVATDSTTSSNVNAKNQRKRPLSPSLHIGRAEAGGALPLNVKILGAKRVALEEESQQQSRQPTKI